MRRALTTVLVWNTETGTPKHTLQHSGWVLVCAFDPSGEYLATGGMDKVRQQVIWRYPITSNICRRWSDSLTQTLGNR